jgi:hypothetical protein
MKKDNINSKNSGVLRFFVYFDKKDKEFVGVCVDLGIIKVGNDPYEVKKDLENATMGYLEVISTNSLPDYLLNQRPPKKYMDMFNAIQEGLKTREVKKSTFDLSTVQSTFFKNVNDLCHAT